MTSLCRRRAWSRSSADWVDWVGTATMTKRESNLETIDRQRAAAVKRMLLVMIRAALHRTATLEVIGRENVPAQGALLVSNHVGWLDPLWLGVAVWPRPIYPMAKSELFKSKLFGWIIRRIGAFPVDRESPGPSALKRPLQIIQQGGLVVIFPGGRRVDEVAEIKRGAATIAALANCPILVARYQGPSTLRIADLFRRPKITVTLAPPFSSPAACRSAASRKAAVAAICDRMEAELKH